MILFAVESSATAASVALMEKDKLIGQFTIHTRLTHSQTLVPMMDALLNTTAMSWQDIDVLTVATGPGSFTGIRIGVSSVKGIAFARDLPCVGVSTLKAMACPLCWMEDTIICSVMDARRQQVYNALFEVQGGALVRMCPDRALSIQDLTQELKGIERAIVLVGDGAELCHSEMKGALSSVCLSPVHLRIQSAVGVAMSAFERAEKGEVVPGDALMPRYLRLPQAERELKKKKETERIG